MRLKRHIPALLFCGLLALSLPAAATDTRKMSTPAEGGKAASPKGDTPYERKYYADPFYDELEQAAKQKSARDIIAMIDLKVQDKPDRINTASLWLRDNSIGQRDIDKVDSLYFMAYSDATLQLARAYQKAGMQDQYVDMLKTSLMSLYVYEMLAGIDALRCADPTVLGAMRENTLQPRLVKFDDGFSLFTKSDFDLFATTAFIADNKFAHRRPNDFICGLGAAHLTDMQRQEGSQTFEAPNPATGKDSTRIIPPRGYSYTPAYVDDTEWGKRRDEMKKHITKLWKDRYERLKKLSGETTTSSPPAKSDK